MHNAEALFGSKVGHINRVQCDHFLFRTNIFWIINYIFLGPIVFFTQTFIDTAFLFLPKKFLTTFIFGTNIFGIRTKFIKLGYFYHKCLLFGKLKAKLSVALLSSTCFSICSLTVLRWRRKPELQWNTSSHFPIFSWNTSTKILHGVTKPVRG